MALIPITLTVGLVLFLGVWVERLLANPLKGLFPGSSEVYQMGMGIAFFLAVAFFVGLLMNLLLVRRLFHWMEERIRQLPLVKTVYGAIQDVMQFLAGGKGEMRGNLVVMVTGPEGWRQLGIVTRQDFTGLPPQVADGNRDIVAVFLPFSYQLGGFTYFIERSRCEPVPGMTVEDAMRYSMMAWIGSAGGGKRETGKDEESTPMESPAQGRP
jgi:uncharacterized membrane protein